MQLIMITFSNEYLIYGKLLMITGHYLIITHYLVICVMLLIHTDERDNLL